MQLLRAEIGTRDAALVRYRQARKDVEQAGGHSSGSLQARLSQASAVLGEASRSVDYYVDLRRQVHDIEMLPIEATAEQMIAQHSDLLASKLGMDFACCPSALAAYKERDHPMSNDAAADGSVIPWVVGMVRFSGRTRVWPIRRQPSSDALLAWQVTISFLLLAGCGIWRYVFLAQVPATRFNVPSSVKMPARRTRGRAMKLEQVAEGDEEWEEADAESHIGAAPMSPRSKCGDESIADWDDVRAEHNGTRPVVIDDDNHPRATKLQPSVEDLEQ